MRYGGFTGDNILWVKFLGDRYYCVGYIPKEGGYAYTSNSIVGRRVDTGFFGD